MFLVLPIYQETMTMGLIVLGVLGVIVSFILFFLPERKQDEFEHEDHEPIVDNVPIDEDELHSHFTEDKLLERTYEGQEFAVIDEFEELKKEVK